MMCMYAPEVSYPSPSLNKLQNPKTRAFNLTRVSRYRHLEEFPLLHSGSRSCSSQPTHHPRHPRNRRHQRSHSAKHPAECRPTPVLLQHRTRLLPPPVPSQRPRRREQPPSKVGRSQSVPNRAGAHSKDENRRAQDTLRPALRPNRR